METITRALATLTILLVLALAACRGTPGRDGGSSAAASPGSNAASRHCDEAYREFKDLVGSLPRDFSGTGDEVARKVSEGWQRAEDLLRSCPDLPARAEVEYHLAYLMAAGFDREVMSDNAEALALATRALELVDRSAAAGAPGSAHLADCLTLRHYLLKKRVSHQSEAEAQLADYRQMRETLRALLPLRTEWTDRALVVLQIADTHLGERDYQKARRELEAAAVADPRFLEFFAYEERLFTALTGCGDLEAMENLVLRRLAEYPERLKHRDLAPRERDSLVSWLRRGEFWAGHIRLAAGDVTGAHEALERQVRQVDELEAELHLKDQTLDPVTRIYRDFRSKDLLTFIDEGVGKRPELDFDLGDLWCSERKVTLGGSRGKVVAALFRTPGDLRARAFLIGLDAVMKREQASGLEALVLSYLTTEKPAAEQREDMINELRELKVDLPAGFDPNTPQPSILLSMKAIWGPSASFIAFDRAGRRAWYLPDPQAQDVAVAERVLKRLLAEPPPGP